jgi:hypothetical protein
VAGHSSAVDVLRLLADSESTGILELAGMSSGTFELRDGRLTAVVTDAVPDLVTRLERGDPVQGSHERTALVRSVILDGAIMLLACPPACPPRFFTGSRPSTGTGEPELLLDVPELLGEVLVRVAVLAESPIGPDDVVAVRPVLGRRSVRIGPVAWRLLHGLGKPRSARSLAWQLGLGLVDTLLALADLVDQQACEAPDAHRRHLPRADPAGHGTGRPGPTPTPRVDVTPRPPAPVRTLSAPSPALAPARPAALPRRRVPTGGLAPERHYAVPDRALLLRVLAGLRRL